MTFETYEKAVSYVESLNRFRIIPGLERIRKVLDLMGNPQKKLKYIHITGTNGKGSVNTLIASVLKEAGYNVGTFTSPYLVDFRDRIRYNNIEISKKDFLDLVNKICQVLDDYNRNSKEALSLPFFEFTTTLMFLYFAMKKPDYVVLEVGMGGVWDATNIIDSPAIAIITNISKDHTHLLGETELEIAKEKAGIIKPGSICVTGVIEDTAARKHIEKTCKDNGAKLVSSKDYEYKLNTSNLDGQIFSFNYKTKNFKDLKMQMLGKYQIHNAAVALTALLEAVPNISEQAIRKGLEKAFWGGRFHIFSRNPLIILDGAHNPAGIQNLREALKELNIEKPVCLVGVAPNKDVEKIAEEFLKISDTFIFTRAQSRGLDKADVKGAFTNLNGNITFDLAELPESFEIAKKLAKEKNKTLVVAGSLYLIGELLKITNSSSQKS